MEVAEDVPCFFLNLQTILCSLLPFFLPIRSQLYIPWGMSFNVLTLLRPGQHPEQCLYVWRGGPTAQRCWNLKLKPSGTVKQSGVGIHCPDFHSNIPTENFEICNLAGMISLEKNHQILISWYFTSLEKTWFFQGPILPTSVSWFSGLVV